MRLPFAAFWLVAAFAASLALAQTAPDRRRSGYQDMGPPVQAMQDDDAAIGCLLFKKFEGLLGTAIELSLQLIRSPTDGHLSLPAFLVRLHFES